MRNRWLFLLWDVLDGESGWKKRKNFWPFPKKEPIHPQKWGFCRDIKQAFVSLTE